MKVPHPWVWVDDVSWEVFMFHLMGATGVCRSYPIYTYLTVSWLTTPLLSLLPVVRFNLAAIVAFAAIVAISAPSAFSTVSAACNLFLRDPSPSLCLPTYLFRSRLDQSIFGSSILLTSGQPFGCRVPQ